MGNCFVLPKALRPRRKKRGAKYVVDKGSGTTSPAEEMALALNVIEATPGGGGDDIAPTMDDLVLEKILRNGNFGAVWAAKERVAGGRRLVVKEVFEPFTSCRDAQTLFREVFYLSKLSQHPNIISLLAIFWATDCRQNICMVMEEMECDLLAALERNSLKAEDKRYITYQLFTAVNYLHSANLVHRNIQPENVLLTNQNVAKLADLGSTRSLSLYGTDDVAQRRPLTDRIGSRAVWYQAPEICAVSSYYTKAVDVWSLGCVVLEMITGQLLCTGLDKIQQFFLIASYLPMPTVADLESLRTPYMHGLGRKAIFVSDTASPGLAERLAGYHRDIGDLIGQMLRFNPTKRCKMFEALSHPYVAQYHDPNQEPSAERDLVPPLTDWNTLDSGEYRAKLEEVMREINKDQRWRGSMSESSEDED